MKLLERKDIDQSKASSTFFPRFGQDGKQLISKDKTWNQLPNNLNFSNSFPGIKRLVYITAPLDDVQNNCTLNVTQLEKRNSSILAWKKGKATTQGSTEFLGGTNQETANWALKQAAGCPIPISIQSEGIKASEKTSKGAPKLQRQKSLGAGLESATPMGDDVTDEAKKADPTYYNSEFHGPDGIITKMLKENFPNKGKWN